MSYRGIIDSLETGQFMSDSIKKRLYTELDNRGLRKVDFPAMIRIAEDVKSWEEEEDEEDINDDYGLEPLISDLIFS
jgi:hypothetical protein